ncbi:MAG: VPLPA-CTERM sorting domain-containing protein [Paracoccaceae bacterium]
MITAGAANAVTVNVTFSASNPDGRTIDGSFSWDATVPGASADQTMVSLTDPGIMDFMVTFATSNSSDTITGVRIAGGLDGTFDLTPVASTRDIVNGAFNVRTICVEGNGGDAGGGMMVTGNGTCLNDNPVGFFAFEGNGPGVFSPATAPGGFLLPVTFTVTEAGGAAAVPVPASLPLLIGALGAGGLIARRRRAKA